MGYYKYFIKKENEGYRFGLYPNNNNNQPLILSKHYADYAQTLTALKNFQSKVIILKENAFIIEKTETGKYNCSFIDKTANFIFDTSNIHYCNDRIKRIILHIEAPLKYI